MRLRATTAHPAVYCGIQQSRWLSRAPTYSELIQPSEPHELFVVPVIESAVSPYEATPDAQRFLVRATARPASQPLTVIVNWPAVLHNPSKMSPQ